MDRNRIVYLSREPTYSKTFSRRKVILVLSLLFFFFFLGGTIYLLRLPRWQIEKIIVDGTETIPRDKIVSKSFEFFEGSYAFLIPKRSIFIASQEKLENFLKKEVPLIASLKMKKEYPNSLKINIKERKLWAIYCVLEGTYFSPSSVGGDDRNGELPPIEKECVYLDKTGFAYERAPSSTGTLILKIFSDEKSISLASQVIPSEKVEKFRRISGVLKQKLGIETIGYELVSKIPGETRVVTSEGFKIWLKLDDDFEAITKILKIVLDEEIKEKRSALEYIDARFGNKVFYKLRK